MFIGALFYWKRCQVPKRLFDAMIRAGVYEEDPSDNRLFVEPCVRCFGSDRTGRKLFEYARSGSNREKAGAVAALYWCPVKGDLQARSRSVVPGRVRVERGRGCPSGTDHPPGATAPALR
jgi:hypothetical protein